MDYVIQRNNALRPKKGRVENHVFIASPLDWVALFSQMENLTESRSGTLTGGIKRLDENNYTVKG
jgi:hypothetical protein